MGPLTGDGLVPPRDDLAQLRDGLDLDYLDYIDVGCRRNGTVTERVALAAMMPFVEGKAVSMLKKGRQAELYSLFVNAQKDLSPEQKKQKTDAYEEKLGLNEDFDLG